MASSAECKTMARVLGHQESLFLALNRFENPLGIYIHVNMIESKHEISIDHVKRAYEDASKNNFLMRACISMDEAGVALFTPINEERLMGDWTIVEEATLELEKDWVDLLPSILERKLDLINGPLWKVRWVSLPRHQDGRYNYIMVYVASHTIADAKCGVNLICNQIMPLLNGDGVEEDCSPSEGEGQEKEESDMRTIGILLNNAAPIRIVDGTKAEDALMVTKSTNNTKNKTIYFAKCVEAVVYGFDDEQVTLSNRHVPFIIRAATRAFLLKQRVGRFFGGSKKSSSPDGDVTAKSSSAATSVNKFNAFTIDEMTTATFLQLCKKRNVTVHSLLMAIIHNAVHRAKIKFMLDLCTDTLLYPIDARKFHDDLGSSDEKMPLGDYHKMGEHAMRFVAVGDEQPFFKMIDEIHNGIAAHNQPVQETTGFDCCFHLLQKNNLTLDTFNALPPPFVLSNMGRCDVISRYDNYVKDVKLTKQFFTLQTPSGLFVSTLTFEKRMHFMLSHGISLTDASEFIVTTIQSNIKTLIENNE